MMPRIIKYLLLVFLTYAILKAPGLLFGRPVPASVLEMYLLFAAAIILLAMTATEDGAAGFIAPVQAILRDPSKRFSRNLILVILPLIAAYVTFDKISADSTPPPAIRSIHPPPPAAFTAYNRTIELAALANPHRTFEKTDPERYAALVKEGGEIYFKNCVYCHGAKLDGRGHYAAGLNPLPLPFRGTDTIAQLQESYVFWRIATGGGGLPREGGPWLSSMPGWKDTLTEDEVWKTILFIYDYTGNSPRTWTK